MLYKEALELYKRAGSVYATPGLTPEAAIKAVNSNDELKNRYVQNIDLSSDAWKGKPVYQSRQDASKYNNVVPRYKLVRVGEKHLPAPVAARTGMRTQPVYKRVVDGYVPSKTDVLEGTPINLNYTAQLARPGQTAVITIGGALDNDRNHLDHETGIPALRQFPFRYTDAEQAKQLARDLMNKGVNVKLIGHSRGGGAADRIGAQLQAEGLDPEIALIDPVSPRLLFGRDTDRKSKGAVVYTPSSKGGFNLSNWIARIGGRLKPKGDEITYNGDHTEGYQKFLTQFTTHDRKGRSLLDRLKTTP